MSTDDNNNDGDAQSNGWVQTGDVVDNTDGIVPTPTIITNATSDDNVNVEAGVTPIGAPNPVELRDNWFDPRG